MNVNEFLKWYEENQTEIEKELERRDYREINGSYPIEFSDILEETPIFMRRAMGLRGC
jgi:hypothetical protein